MIRSQLLYCLPVWRPHLIKDIKKLEQLQHRVTKCILNDYVSNYKTRLTNLKKTPFDVYLGNIWHFVPYKNLKIPTNNFNVNNYISFSTSNTRTHGIKLWHNIGSTNKEWHFYFNRISHLWNSIPIIDLNLPVDTIKIRNKAYFWDHFTTNFQPEKPHKSHYLCPCGSCAPYNFPINYNIL